MIEVQRIAVIGSGIMGRGIAQVAAMGGFRTAMQDIAPEALEKAVDLIRQNLDKGVSLGKVEPGVREAALANLRSTTDFEEAVRDADLVIEAVPEEIALKLDVFARLDRHAPAHAVLATNTTSQSITEIAAATRRPHKVIGMHFFNPVHLMRLVEIVRGLETDDETFQVAEAVSRRMGKETVEVKEFPGFVTSRMNALIGNEAFKMLEEGVASAEDIDKAIKLGLNHPMGPFEMIDLVGLDTRLKSMEYLHQTLGERFRPSPLLIQYVKAGRLGRKTGKGIYDYTGDGEGKGKGGAR